MFYLTITYRNGQTERRTYLEVAGATSGFNVQTGNLMVRDAVLTGPNGKVLAERHA